MPGYQPALLRKSPELMQRRRSPRLCGLQHVKLLLTSKEPCWKISLFQVNPH